METAIKPVDDVCNSISKMQTQFGQALPPQIPVERFMRVAMTAIRTSPSLAECERASLFNAFIQAAQDGLLPDGREGAIVPFSGKAKWMPMVGGLCKKARNSGEIKMIDAQVVCAADKYRSWTDEHGPHFLHEKAIGDRGEDILTYAYALTHDGGLYFEEVDEKQMDAVKAVAKTKNVWDGPFKQEMKRKTALRRLAKYRLPSNTDLDDLVRRDDDMYDLEKEKPMRDTNQKTRLETLIEAKAEPVVQVAQEAPTGADGVMMDYKVAIDEADSEDNVKRLLGEAKPKVGDENFKMLEAHGNLKVKKLKGVK